MQTCHFERRTENELRMTRSAGVLSKPEDGGAYKAYRHLRRVLSREQQVAEVRRSLALPRDD